MIIRGGENLYPAEVERVILELRGVSDCAVIGLPDSFWGEIVAAVLVADGVQFSAADVILHCKKFLASYRCPEKVFFRSGLPYNMTGKVDRQALLKEIAKA
jgi:fatty-acyl-CoA synthase